MTLTPVRRHVAAGLLLMLMLPVFIGGCTRSPAVSRERPAAAPAVTRAIVTKHTDGDTAHMRLSNGAEEKVRFIGIDTPEVAESPEPYGQEASAYTARAIPIGSTVWLEFDAERRDQYGRLLAYVWLDEPADGSEAEVRAKMLNAQLVSDGYAQVYTFPPNVTYTEVFARFQTEAREAERGLWAGD